MKQLLYIALISTGLISQPVVLAMSQAIDLSALSQTGSSVVMDDGRSMMAMQTASHPANQKMVISNASDKMPCHTSVSKGFDTKGLAAQDCNDCCDSDCLAANNCLTSCTISPFVVNRTSSFAHNNLIKVISAFLTPHTQLRRSSVIFHPPKYS